MYQSDDAAAARMRIEDEALNRQLPRRVEPTRFAQKTALIVLVEFLPGTDMCEHLIFTMKCDLWVDRNIILREQGINPATAETATAYWCPDKQEFIVTGTKGSLCRALREQLGLL